MLLSYANVAEASEPDLFREASKMTQG